jgi:hypothetical protein
MASEAAKFRLDVSKEALKTTYYVVIGIAITEALSRALVHDNVFLGAKLFDLLHLPAMLLLLTFLVTSSRFVHGASIHLGNIDAGGAKALFDYCGFFLQATLFYIMALSVRDSYAFLVSFIALLVGDFLWLFALCRLGYLSFRDTARQWVYSDLIIIVALVALLYFDPGLRLPSVITVALVSCVAAVVDYRANWPFYFPPETGSRKVEAATIRRDDKASGLRRRSWGALNARFWSVLGGASLVTIFVLWRQAEIQLTKNEIKLHAAQEQAAGLKRDAQSLSDDINAWKQKAPILDFFGPHVTEFHVRSLQRAVGESFDFGICPSAHCLHIRVADINEMNNRPNVALILTGQWGNLLRVSGQFVSNVPIIQGCATFIRTRAVDIGIGVLDDRAASLTLAAGIRPGTLREPGVAMKIEMNQCLPENEE